MKTDLKENNQDVKSGSLLLLKLFVFLVVLPVLVPTLAMLMQGLIWCHVLSCIEGINFSGGLWEAFALSLALGCAVLSINACVGATGDLLRKLGKLPPRKPVLKKPTDTFTWDDFYKALPGFRSFFYQLTVTAAALWALSCLQPVHLRFDGPYQIFLAAGVLSATWIFYISLATFVVYMLAEQQKKDTPSGKAVV
jgi:hypothetical protein